MSTSVYVESKRILRLSIVATLALTYGCNPAVTPETEPLRSAAQAQANYVGEAVCTACHQVEDSHWSHTAHARIFRTNPRDPLQAKSCEACHGPGSEHLIDQRDKTKIIAFTRDSGIPIARQNGMCLQCHRGGERIHWLGSVHETSDLACSDCHNPMALFSSTGLLKQEGISQTCFTCHQQQRAEFRKRSHMPLLEGKMTCADCHNPHGSNTDPMLKAESVNQVVLHVSCGKARSFHLGARTGARKLFELPLAARLESRKAAGNRAPVSVSAMP